ncbi:hypothetical protein V496_01740 [Pseudogymnoascus sp. VKM F-4515 (FW-2607)]|nr:hypothetical protein V496_01740 [Pseudogymnoascus sp. VKM F-4515 (FW-2607)]KFY92853.1 hypothetical protein V498_04730 [Pseudogymnoascus sp. VKM F-4517 (FW-2822)]
MPSSTSLLRTSLWVLAGTGAIYAICLGALTGPFVQRHSLYMHKLHTAYFEDLNKPEQWGFAKNQITPFNFTTPDGETLYAWHVMPLGLYAKHEEEIIKQPSGLAEDIRDTKAFDLLRSDPQARLIISFHGNGGTVAQGWRPEIYRALSDGSTSTIHILAVDYRGYGYSSGIPSESGLIADGIATVNWALDVAKIPPSRIVIVGHSLGTAVTAATVEHFAEQDVSFAGVVVIAPFARLTTLLTRYSPGGLIPLLGPVGWIPGFDKWFFGLLVDKWNSAQRVANVASISKRLKLFIVHARDDWNIPYTHSDTWFAAAANAATPGISGEVFVEKKASNTVHMGDGGSISTWTAPGKFIQEILVPHGGHNVVMTFPSVALAVLKAFDIDEENVL